MAQTSDPPPSRGPVTGTNPTPRGLTNQRGATGVPIPNLTRGTNMNTGTSGTAHTGNFGGSNRVIDAATTQPTTTPPSRRQPMMSRFPDPLPVERPGALTQFLAATQAYIFSEETLVLVEFLLVLAVGVVAFVSAYPIVYNLVQNGMSLLHKNFGIF